MIINLRLGFWRVFGGRNRDSIDYWVFLFVCWIWVFSRMYIRHIGIDVLSWSSDSDGRVFSPNSSCPALKVPSSMVGVYWISLHECSCTIYWRWIVSSMSEVPLRSLVGGTPNTLQWSSPTSRTSCTCVWPRTLVLLVEVWTHRNRVWSLLLIGIITLVVKLSHLFIELHGPVF